MELFRRFLGLQGTNLSTGCLLKPRPGERQKAQRVSRQLHTQRSRLQFETGATRGMAGKTSVFIVVYPSLEANPDLELRTRVQVVYWEVQKTPQGK